MPFAIVRNDITLMDVDAIVNSANPRPVVGSGADAAIHHAAGPDLLRCRKKLGLIGTGEAEITPGFRLKARYVIHTVGPVWEGGGPESVFLRECYRNCLRLAAEYKLESIAFPLISSGNYGFPKPLALQIAREEISRFLMEQEMMVYLVVFDKEAYALSGSLMRDIQSFIDEAYVQERERTEYSFSIRNDYSALDELFSSQSVEEEIWSVESRADAEYAPRPFAPRSSAPIAPRPEAVLSPGSAFPNPRQVECAEAGESLSAMLQKLDAGFTETLLSYIDRSGKKDSEIYKKANIDRKLFSKIRKNPHYKPSKPTALAFAIALELDLDQTRDLIGRAGHALSRCSKFDVIIEYFITRRRYDIHEINMTLFEFDQSLLGA